MSQRQTEKLNTKNIDHIGPIETEIGNSSDGQNSLWLDSWKRFKKNRAAVFSGYFVLFLCMVAICAQWLAPYRFDVQHMDAIFDKPSLHFWLGTDNLGRDMLSRLIYGARVSIAVGIITALFSLVLGAIYGSISGWFGGWVDSCLMRVIDIIYSFPSLVLLILVKIFFDSINVFENLPEVKAMAGILLALSIEGWTGIARLVRGQILQVKELTYIEAARALGAKGPWIVFWHIYPNILGPVVVMLTYTIPSCILSESFLSFIGLGLQPPFSSWGVLANEGWRTLKSYPHLIIFPGLAIFVSMLAFNLLGDGLRDAVDPKMKDR